MKIFWQDIVILTAFLLYFGAGFATNFALAEVKKYTEAATVLEGNPIARQALNFQYGLFMLQVSEVALLGGIYYLMRRHFAKTKKDYDYSLLGFYSVAVLLIFLQNVLNDFAIALKLFIGGG